MLSWGRRRRSVKHVEEEMDEGRGMVRGKGNMGGWRRVFERRDRGGAGNVEG